ncbi:MAG: hypothetical protein CYPHOPRED_000407 [Cyphobasidiales sp. Tagirdzhanova-0007]|nr:MAG: hypothetical protein CYPHOPRED_000407 [Cyphobasidiales sp. Tagirdzhanova-0007]
MLIKSAAVPHYSRANGKVLYAVRVCLASPTAEPYTVYRRWDEFLDLSSKLANAFQSAEADNSSSFRRVPRLSRKVTLFVTASTITSRRDELDLFVRHLFNLPKAITTYPLVKEFFSIRNNRLDGLSPPSPTPSQHAHYESPVTVRLKAKEHSPHPTNKEHSAHDAPTYSFRPVLGAKRSTPDLRRFISSHQVQEDELTISNPSPGPYPSQLNFRFPRSTTSSTIQSNATGSTVHSNATSTTADTLRASTSNYLMQPPSSPKNITVLTPDTYDMPTSPGGSDASSMRTTSTSTIKPSISGSFSRISSPLSFLSDGSDTPQNVSPKPAPGALRHFRSLQDIRAAISPQPQVHSVASNTSLMSPGITRTRSNSKLVTKPLPLVAEDESPAPSPTSSTSGGGRSLFRSNPFASPHESRFHRPSINSLRRLRTQQISTQTQQYSHNQSPSASSIDSSDSSSSLSLSRSQSSSAGLGLDFSASSRESLDFSDHSCLGSPDTAFSPLSPIVDDKLEHWQMEKPVQVVNSNSFVWNNHLPPLTFFQMPSPNEPAYVSPHSLTNSGSMSRRHGRHRASSLHQPVLETILASPILGESEPNVTLKVMTEKSNFLLKMPRSANLRVVKEKIAGKCQNSDILLPTDFDLALYTSSQSSGGTATASLACRSISSVMSLGNGGQAIKLEDEQDWQLALSLSTAKITLKVI